MHDLHVAATLPHYTLPMGSRAAYLRRAETIGSSLLFERSFGVQCMQYCLHTNAMLSFWYPLLHSCTVRAASTPKQPALTPQAD